MPSQKFMTCATLCANGSQKAPQSWPSVRHFSSHIMYGTEEDAADAGLFDVPTSASAGAEAAQPYWYEAKSSE